MVNIYYVFDSLQNYIAISKIYKKRSIITKPFQCVVYYERVRNEIVAYG